MPSPDHADLRAPSTPHKRHLTRLKKYNHFKHIKPGQLGAPHYHPADRSALLPVFPALLRDAPVEVWGKRRMYAEAQLWPRPPTYHRSSGKGKGRCRSRGLTCRWGHQKALNDGVERALGREVWREDLDGDERGEGEGGPLFEEAWAESAWGRGGEDGGGEGEERGGLGELVDRAVGRWDRKVRRAVEAEGWWIVEREMASSPGVISLDDELDSEDEFELI